MRHRVEPVAQAVASSRNVALHQSQLLQPEEICGHLTEDKGNEECE